MTLRATVFHQYGGPEVLTWEEVSDPDFGPGDVVIRVEACGLNHCDLDSRAGTSRWDFEFPMVLGGEFAGTIAAVGADVEGLELGAPVTALQHFFTPEGQPYQFGIDCWGGYAEYVCVPASTVVRLQSRDQIDAAAASQTVASTAWRMVTTLGNVQAGETVLVPSASGGVASTLVGVAKLRGARVIASVGSTEKVSAVEELGADVVFSYKDASVNDVVQSATSGRGVDCVLDTVGGDMFDRHLEALRLDGRFVTCGAHAGEMVQLDIVRLFQHGHRIIGFGFASDDELRTALELVLDGRLTVPIAASFPLPEASLAHVALAERAHVGKVLLRVPQTGGLRQEGEAS